AWCWRQEVTNVRLAAFLPLFLKPVDQLSTTVYRRFPVSLGRTGTVHVFVSGSSELDSSADQKNERCPAATRSDLLNAAAEARRPHRPTGRTRVEQEQALPLAHYPDEYESMRIIAGFASKRGREFC